MLSANNFVKSTWPSLITEGKFMDDQVKQPPEEGVPEDEGWATPLTEEALKEVSGGMCQPSPTPPISSGPGNP